MSVRSVRRRDKRAKQAAKWSSAVCGVWGKSKLCRTDQRPAGDFIGSKAGREPVIYVVQPHRQIVQPV